VEHIHIVYEFDITPDWIGLVLEKLTHVQIWFKHIHLIISVLIPTDSPRPKAL